MDIKLNDLQEILEQLRAGFTISRMTFGTLTMVYSICKKDDKWAKKFTKIQNEYHKFLLDAYKDIEQKYKEKEMAESNEFPVPDEVIDEFIQTKPQE